VTESYYNTINHRSIISIGGSDRFNFLQSIVTNDVEKSTNSHAVWAALLSPQGKFLHDFFIIPNKERLLLTCEKEREEDLLLRLNRLKLRADINLKKEENLCLSIFWSRDIPNKNLFEDLLRVNKKKNQLISFADPRIHNAGIYIISESNTLSKLFNKDIKLCPYSNYEKFRIELGLPDGSKDMPIEKSYLLENGFKELNGIDFKKGCYIGQEVTARMNYRALIKKRLLPVKLEGPIPPNGCLLEINNKKAGKMISSVDDYGFALVNIKDLSNSTKRELNYNNTKIKPIFKKWMEIDWN
jgi:hypothetical protein